MDKLPNDSCTTTASSSSSSTPTSTASSHKNHPLVINGVAPSNASDQASSLLQQNECQGNIFQFPPPSHLSETYAESSQCESEFCKLLNNCIAQGCRHSTQQGTCQPVTLKTPPHDSNAFSSTPTSKTPEDDLQNCATCKKLRDHCLQFIDPLQDRLGLSITAALAAYGAVEQLSRLYEMLDEYCNLHRTVEQPEPQQQYSLQKQVNENQIIFLNENMAKELNQDNCKSLEQNTNANKDEPKITVKCNNQTEATMRREAFKQQRQICKSVTADSIPLNSHKDVTRLQRQNTYSGGKSKVSKWTRVKAAFKWERANVPAACSNDHHHAPNSVGLMPINHEVARYLRVPTTMCGGGSSADSVLSSSSGHILSETATPATMSSASSLDDLDSSYRKTMKRSALKGEKCCSDDGEQKSPPAPSKKCECTRSSLTTKCFPTKSNRKGGKVVSGFEVLPEGDVVNIKHLKKSRPRLPPSPLDLNLQQDLNELDFSYSPHALRSPKECTQSLNPLRKISSPGNSSVPSSPSRHSDVFAEFESEDLSDGDFSEPSTPSQPLTFKSLQQQHEDINRRYQLLCAKLDKEFEAKKRQWEKSKANPNANTYRALTLITPPKSEEHSPNPAINANLSAEMLEENLTPDFKKKLRKWRVKKEITTNGIGNATQLQFLTHQQVQSESHLHTPSQTQINGLPSNQHQCISPNKETKFDWNLWKSVSNMKLEFQDQPTLPTEEFQKKLEQWEKIKRGFHLINSGTDSLKRATKHKNEYGKKAMDEDHGSNGGEKEKRAEKQKTSEKDKLEKLVRLKAIVAEPPAKEIEVKTSVGVMKFEGISRKFTRKLYEWEKAKGIGPESSTFALLHPGYCPLDVGRIPKENHNSDNAPLSRSLSLDSITPVMSLPAVSHQASSLSLNDVDDLKETDMGINSSDPLLDSEFDKTHEPEAVMVEVEDHIVDTASALISVHAEVEQQLPVYKYEQSTCNDYCNSRRIQSFESYTNLAPLLSALQRTDELLLHLKQTSPDIAGIAEMQQCLANRDYIRSIYPYFMEILVQPNVLNAISDVQAELSRLKDLLERCPLDEACCQEIIDERTLKYNEELRGLQESLDLLGQQINNGQGIRYPSDMIPHINITAVDLSENILPIQSEVTSGERELSTTLEATDELSASANENELPGTPKSTTTQVQRTFSNSSSVGTAAKRRMRLRKMGSRQNSKTESDSSEDDVEPQRRIKRRSYRLKQRSFEEDCSRKSEDTTQDKTNDDVVYVLKVRPGYPIEQSEQFLSIEDTEKSNQTKDCVAPTPAIDQVVQPQMQAEMLPLKVGEDKSLLNCKLYENVFVKTKRKVFTTISEPNALDGIVFISQDIDNSTASGESIKDEDRELLETNFGLPDMEEIEMSGRLKLSGLKKRAFSLPNSFWNVQQKCFELERYCCSLEQLNVLTKASKDSHMPLALDSLIAVNNLTAGISKASDYFKAVPKSKMYIEHIFRKHSKYSKPQTQNASRNGSVKRYEEKLLKNYDWASNSTAEELSQRSEHYSSELPSWLNSVLIPSAPSTPLTERAIHLQKAKEDFLKGEADSHALQKQHGDCKLHDEQLTGENHISQSISIDNDLPTGTKTNKDSIAAPCNATSEQEPPRCETLQPPVRRSCKMSSKLGFAKLASKFRSTKSKKDKDEDESKRSNFLALRSCTVLLSDVSRLVNHEKRLDPLVKSQSSPQAATGVSMGAVNNNIAKLQKDDGVIKSQSEQYIKPQKESYV